MTAPIDFYFDFASPYGYLAATQIDGIAERHGRRVRWCPILLGAAQPVHILTPTSTVRRIVNMTALTAVDERRDYG